jgi:hypothetical protein
MSTKGIYVVYDRLAQMALGGPLFFAHDGPAVRFFRDVMADKSTSVAKFPQDHVLLKVGEFNEDEVEASDVQVVMTGTLAAELNAPAEA